MSTNNNMDNIATTEEYFILLGKNPEELTPIENLRKGNYERFIKSAMEYSDLITPETLEVLNSFNSRLLAISGKDEKSNEEEKLIAEFSLIDQNNTESLNNDGPTRRLTKAGYVDASIILVIVLNLGFIIALSILGAR